MADSAADLVDNTSGGGAPIQRDGGVWGPPSHSNDNAGGTALLTIEYRTWHRDSHELFDYESQHIYRGKHNLRRSARIFRNGNDITMDEEFPSGSGAAGGSSTTGNNNNGDYLLSIKARDGRYYVFPADRSAVMGVQARKLWLITRFLPASQYPLSEGDVIKLGRFKLRIKQIVPEDCYNVMVDYRLDDSGDEGAPRTTAALTDTNAEDSAGADSTIQCRICLLEGSREGEEEDAFNPMIRPCQCKGSIMYVHLGCLRHWVNGKLNLAEDLSRSCCFVRQIQCELCKATFPSFITNKDGDKLPVVKIPQLQPPFIVLENMVGPANKGVHLCSLAQKKECKLGRGHESDVRIADVSISRWHATIKYVNGVFQLEDHNSKFGTLVALRRPVIMDSQVDRLSVQVGRTVMDLGILGGGASGTAPPTDGTRPPAPLSMVEDMIMER